MAWKIAEHLLALAIASFMLLTIWLYAFAIPLKIEKITLDKSVYRPGERIVVNASSDKPKWAARFCTAVSASINVRNTKTNQIDQFAPRAMNFNSGAVKQIVEIIDAPNQPGPFRVTKRVAYRCFFARLTVSSNPDGYGWGFVKVE